MVTSPFLEMDDLHPRLFGEGSKEKDFVKRKFRSTHT